MLSQVTLQKPENNQLVIKSLPDLLIYVQSHIATVKNRNLSLYDYGSRKLLDLHSTNSHLYIDKYFETCIPDIQTEFLFESKGLSECDYDAWLEDRGRFWVNSCTRDGVMSEFVTPNIKGRKYNPYVRFLRSKSSGSSQVNKLLDLVGCNFQDPYSPHRTVFNLLTLTFPYDVAILLVDPKKRDCAIKKMWKCYKLFFKELHLYYGLPSDHVLGASVSLHLWSSSFPFLPHPHFHAVQPHFSYLNVNDTLEWDCTVGKHVHVRNDVRDLIEGCSVTGGASDKSYCSSCAVSDACISRLYDKMYSLVHKQDISMDGGDKKTHCYISKDNLPELCSLQIELSKALAEHLQFTPLSWDGLIVKTSDRGIDYNVSLPVDVDVFKSMWSDCVNEVFKKEFNELLKEKQLENDFVDPSLDIDVTVESLYDVHTQFVKPEQKAKLMHHLQYKCRPPVLDLDLFFRKCQNFVTGYDSLDPDAVISFIRSKWVYAVLHDDLSGSKRFESLLIKAERLFSDCSSSDIYNWLQFLCLLQTDTRVFGFWRSIKRYCVTSVVRGSLPKSHICPICGGDIECLLAVNILYVDAIVVHLGSRFLYVNVKDPPNLRGDIYE